MIDNKINFTDELIPVEGQDGWYRDPNSNAVINCNIAKYDEYIAQYEARQNKKKDFTTLQSDVDGLKSDIGDVKDLLKLLLNKEND
tara:strand:- start:118 stop:375 length:258 start_codon:yes stop_codon:yes gene_type:complete